MKRGKSTSTQAKRRAGEKRPSGASKYATKKAQQANGKFAPTSPFRMVAE